MDVHFRIGECFTTYKDLEEKIKRFVRSSWSPLYIRESRKITCTRRAPNKVVNESLVYGDLRYCCIHGGRSGDAQNRKSTHQISCPFMMTLRADADGRYLRVTKAILEHNHPVSKEIYDKLPRRFRIRFDPEAHPAPSARRKAKKVKLVRHSYSLKREEALKADPITVRKQEPIPAAENHLIPSRVSMVTAADPPPRLPSMPATSPSRGYTDNHCWTDNNNKETPTAATVGKLLPPKKRRTSSLSGDDLHDALISQLQGETEQAKESALRGALLSFLQRHEEQDEEDKFFSSMAAVCRTLPTDVRATLKFRIHHMIFDAQMDSISQT